MLKNLKSDLKLIFRGIKYFNETEHNLAALIVVQHTFIALAPFVNIVMSGLILDKLAGGNSLFSLIILVVVMVILNFAVSMLNKYLSRIVRSKKFLFEDKNDILLSYKAINMDYENIENPEVNNWVNQMREDAKFGFSGIWSINGGLMKATTSIAQIIFSVAVSFKVFTTFSNNHNTGILSFFTSPISSIVLIFIIIGNIAVSMYANSAGARKNFSILSDFNPFNRFFFFYLNNYLGGYHAGKDIRIYNQKNFVLEEQMSQFEVIKERSNKLANVQSGFDIMIATAAVLLNACVLAFVGMKSLSGLFGVGSIVVYSGSINQFITGFTDFMSSFSQMRANNIKLKEHFDYLELPDKKVKGDKVLSQKDLGNMEFEFKNVSFKYPGTEKYVLKNINKKLNFCQKLAIVGENGSGKTTFIKLLCRLYDPLEGEILLNGVNIKEYNYKQYISVFSVVFQDFTLFAQTIAQNVAVSVTYDGENVKKRLEQAGFSNRLNTLDNGVETFLYKDFEQSGIEISGGEAQKIAIARALYKNSPVVVLDEPTSALDPISESEIYLKFNDLVNGKTAIYISHRLSSCRFCDTIMVFDNGNIVQQGTHEKLVADTNGKYFKLWNAQAQYYTI